MQQPELTVQTELIPNSEGKGEDSKEQMKLIANGIDRLFLLAQLRPLGEKETATVSRINKQIQSLIRKVEKSP